MKIKALLFSVALVATVFTGCGQQAQPAATTKPAETSTQTAKEAPKADAATGASIAKDEAAFEMKIMKDNSDYMVITTKDLTFTKDLTVESGVKKGTDGKDAPNRSIGLAHEIQKDGKAVVDKRYTLTVPAIVMKGENQKFEYGIVKGDVYVQGKGFTLKDQTIEGNLYFANDELKNAFKPDATTKITGQVAVKAYQAK